jgi:hypothetical protein
MDQGTPGAVAESGGDLNAWRIKPGSLEPAPIWFFWIKGWRSHPGRLHPSYLHAVSYTSGECSPRIKLYFTVLRVMLIVHRLNRFKQRL